MSIQVDLEFCETKFKLLIHTIQLAPSWLWSYGRSIYNYLCNQCLSSLKLWVLTPFMVRCTWYNIMWKSLSVTCDRSVVFSVSSSFLHDITEVLLNTTNPNHTKQYIYLVMIVVWEVRVLIWFSYVIFLSSAACW